jgi:dihydrofolate reductase
MPKLRVHNFTITLDGYGAAANQTREHPMGGIEGRLHEWMLETRFGHEMMEKTGGSEGIDNDFALAGDVNIGATIMGSNMYGQILGEWEDDWTGWWGPNPPYHHPVFVLTQRPHAPVPMEGGTTFNFVTDGIEAALEQAYDAAGGQDVRIGGGAATVQQYLRARLVDELHLVIAPLFAGGGERLFDHLDGGPEGYEVVEMISAPTVVHVRLAKTTA